MDTEMQKKIEELVKEGFNVDEAMERVGFKKSSDLQKIMNKVVQDAKNKFPYFPYPTPFRNLKNENGTLKEIVKFSDESLDNLLGENGFRVTKGYLKYYHDEIVKFEIDEMLESMGSNIVEVLQLVNYVGDLIRDNSERQIYIQNIILYILDEYNKTPGAGLVMQTLFLQGLIKWFEGCDLNDGEPGSEEAQNLCNWIGTKFFEACNYFFLLIGQNEQVQPLYNYLNTLEIGQVCNNIQNENFRKDDERYSTKEPLRDEEETKDCHPEIFKKKEHFDLFKEYVSNTSKKNWLREYSFIYRAMIRDKYIHESVSVGSYKEFFAKVFPELEYPTEIKTYDLCFSTERDLRYNVLKNKWIKTS